uniref:Uncharacterized protein n=1 Tax=Esox lucius TaxID=8010 RepID=A0A6Q2X0Z7_ESOLU
MSVHGDISVGHGSPISWYLCRLWTPPSIWADVVLFSNFRSPEYIMFLCLGFWDMTVPRGLVLLCTCSIWSGSPGSYPWRLLNPCLCTSSPRWWPPGESPSSLERQVLTARTFHAFRGVWVCWCISM